MSGGLRPPILKFTFQNPISCNRKRHHTLCSNSTGGMSWEFRPALPLAEGSDPGGYVRGVMSANLSLFIVNRYSINSVVCKQLHVSS